VARRSLNHPGWAGPRAIACHCRLQLRWGDGTDGLFARWLLGLGFGALNAADVFCCPPSARWSPAWRCIAGIRPALVATGGAAISLPATALARRVVLAGHHQRLRSLACRVLIRAAGARQAGPAIGFRARLDWPTHPGVREVLQVMGPGPTLSSGIAADQCVHRSVLRSSGIVGAAAARLRNLWCRPCCGLLSNVLLVPPAAGVRPGSRLPPTGRPWWAAFRPGPDCFQTPACWPLGALDGGLGRPDRRPRLRAGGPSTARPPPGRWFADEPTDWGCRPYLGRDVLGAGVLMPGVMAWSPFRFFDGRDPVHVDLRDWVPRSAGPDALRGCQLSARFLELRSLVLPPWAVKTLITASPFAAWPCGSARRAPPAPLGQRPRPC